MPGICRSSLLQGTLKLCKKGWVGNYRAKLDDLNPCNTRCKIIFKALMKLMKFSMEEFCLKFAYLRYR